MITLQVKDSRKKNRTLVISGFVNDHGTKCARIQSDNGKEYFVRVKKDGSGTCTCESRKPCYHITAVASIRLLTVAELEQVAANAELDVIAQAIEVVKSLEPAYGTCGHLVKPGHENEECGGCIQKMYM